jgi:hypothetical protein
MPLSEIRTHNPSVRASEDSSCLRPRGHCDRLSAPLICTKCKYFHRRWNLKYHTVREVTGNQRLEILGGVKVYCLCKISVWVRRLQMLTCNITLNIRK